MIDSIDIIETFSTLHARHWYGVEMHVNHAKVHIWNLYLDNDPFEQFSNSLSNKYKIIELIFPRQHFHFVSSHWVLTILLSETMRKSSYMLDHEYPVAENSY